MWFQVPFSHNLPIPCMFFPAHSERNIPQSQDCLELRVGNIPFRMYGIDWFSKDKVEGMITYCHNQIRTNMSIMSTNWCLYRLLSSIECSHVISSSHSHPFHACIFLSYVFHSLFSYPWQASCTWPKSYINHLYPSSFMNHSWCLGFRGMISFGRFSSKSSFKTMYSQYNLLGGIKY